MGQAVIPAVGHGGMPALRHRAAHPTVVPDVQHRAGAPPAQAAGAPPTGGDRSGRRQPPQKSVSWRAATSVESAGVSPPAAGRGGGTGPGTAPKRGS